MMGVTKKDNYSMISPKEMSLRTIYVIFQFRYMEAWLS